MRHLVVIALLAVAAQAGDEPSTKELLAQLNDPDTRVRQDAATKLATRGGDEVPAAARKRLETEQSFHVRLALQYVLAAHGDLDAVRAIVKALEHTGHLGTLYLRWSTGADYGWDREAWARWLEEVDAREFRHVRQRSFLDEEERDAGWPKFEAAVSALEKGAGRAQVAADLRAVAEAHPKSDPGYFAAELADRLAEMAKEDAGWKEPANPETLPLEDRIRYAVHHVRDVTGVADPEQGTCDVLARGKKGSAFDAARALLDIGKPALPHLLDLLDDERPTRAVARFGDAHFLKVLRCQDVAIQIINAMQPEPLFGAYSAGAYLSDSPPSWRKQVVATLRRWHRDGCKSDEASVLWLVVDLMGIYPSLEALEALATKYERKKDVLAKLHDWYDNRHWVYQPHYAALMAELGDKSKVEEVVGWYHEGRYSKTNVERPDDGAASMNAREAARRLAEGLPRMSADQRWRDSGYGRR